ncbi:MAG: pseudouridine-5'-phosphate glycosidase [Lachnospiraceae bacterium]|nr:pseudouridine-5'-phosphate glycosidase [Lachnospiraceae bacterium]
MNKYIDFTDEVKEALDNNKPIVAIETGGTFEGIPYPENVETANTVMNEIRKAGAVPAYVSIINGRVKVGMTDTEINEYAKLRGKMTKASGREIPQIIAKGSNGVMTIAATMLVADYVGIPVVTGGGIGGVHRGAETTMDISSDLEEIAIRNVIVVCSGAKSILDLKLTMEYLETKGVSIIGYKTDELPAYMARTSGIKLSSRMDDISMIADTYNIKNSFNIKTGIILANPIDEEYAVDSNEMNRVIDEAVSKSIKDNITGKAITGYLMKYLKENMGSDSMEAQKHMIIQNAILAAKVAGQITTK